MILDLSHLFIAYRRIGTLDHGINQVEMLTIPFAGFHRATAYKYGRYIQTHRCHQHARGNLITIADAHHGICLMSIHHILYRIGNDVSARQGIEHAIVSHGNAIVYGNGIELGSKTTKFLDFGLHLLTDFVQMRMSGDKLSERVDDGHDRLANHFSLHSVGYPKSTGSCHAATLCTERTA